MYKKIFLKLNPSKLIIFLVTLSLFSPIFEYLFAIEMLSETIAVLILFCLFLNIKINFELYSLNEISVIFLLSLYLLVYLMMNYTDNTLYKTVSLLYSVSLFFLSKYLINYTENFIFFCKKISSFLIFVILILSLFNMLSKEHFSLDSHFSLVLSLILICIVIYEFEKKRINNESLIHIVFILYTAQIKVIILLIVSLSFLLISFSGDRTKLKNYRKIIITILCYFFISFFFSKTVSIHSLYFENLQKLYLNTKQLIVGERKGPDHKLIIGLKNIKKFDYEENLEELENKTEGPAYSSLNYRLTEWQTAKNKIKTNNNFFRLSGLEDNQKYYHNIIYGIIINYGYSGLLIFIILISYIILSLKNDIFKFFKDMVCSNSFIFLFISGNYFLIYLISMPYYHAKFLTLFLGFAFYNKINSKKLLKK